MTLASQGVSDALDAYKAGDKDKAYKLARSAYLDHFEFVEVPLRLRNPNLVLDTEFTFAELRNDIRSGASVSTVRGSVVKLRHQLLERRPRAGEEGHRRARDRVRRSPSRSCSARASRRCC